MLNATTPARSPLALVGMACRFPGASSAQELWRVLRDGECTLRAVPADRYNIDALHDPQPGARGRIVTREGGFLEDVRGFDAGFFKISPREAAFMDPQHRLLLEVAWDALEDAGLAVSPSNGARAGVYVGLFTSDYRERLLKRAEDDLDVYCEIGTTRSSAAGRIAHAFNLTGPTVAVDGACASSLAAVHLACQSLWSGESTFAVAAGCNLVLEPETTMCFSRSRMLSPESRCRFGDANAQGFVRSDGVGVVVLKRLDDALRDRDRIYALVRETRVTNDARLGKGLFMTPSVEGQVELLHRAWVEGGLDIDRAAFIEAHGTGTRAGDPVECEAIARVLGTARRAGRPLYVGSVKTNIGHTEGAAGVAGLIKAALSLHHRVLPASLHLQNPNPEIPWERGRLAIPTTQVPLGGGRHLAGVSSFGLSGTNAHVVLESYESQAPTLGGTLASAYLLPVSGHSPDALRQRASALAAHLATESTPVSLQAICATASMRRAHLAFRAGVVGASAAEMAEALRTLAASADPPRAREDEPKVAMMFPGQGGQWLGMGRELLRRSSCFREVLEEMHHAICGASGPSVLDDLASDDVEWTRDPSRLQPALFAVEVGLAAWWRGVGVRVDAVLGHSMGEVAAACFAGALTPQDAARVICVRSRYLARLRGRGRMALLGVDPETATRWIEAAAPRVSLAVQNARNSTVISGDSELVAEILQRVTATGAYGAMVDVDAASHSAQVDAFLSPMHDELAQIRPRNGDTRFFSTVDAAWRDGASLDAAYWCRNLRHMVRFWSSTNTLLDGGFKRFIEAGPHPVLAPSVQQTIRERGHDAIAIGTTRRNEAEERSTLNALAVLYADGFVPNWTRVQRAGPQVDLPPYPFQHETYWFRESAMAAPGERALASATQDGRRSTVPSPKRHPMLGEAIHLGGEGGDLLWNVPLSTTRQRYLIEHAVRGAPVLPGAAYVELALAAGRQVFPTSSLTVENAAFREYLAVPTRSPMTLQVRTRRIDANSVKVTFHGFDDATPTGDARFHAEATLRAVHATHGRSEHPSDPFRSPRALFSEALRVEIARRQHNGDYRFAVVSATVVSTPTSQNTDTVARILREIVRSGDEVFPIVECRWAVVLRDLSPSVSQAQVAARLRALLRERLSSNDSDSVWKVSVQLLEPCDDARQVAEQLSAEVMLQVRLNATSLPPPVSPRSLDAEAFYHAMERRGIIYGPLFRPIRGVETTTFGASAQLAIPSDVAKDSARYEVHPALLDGFFQAASVPFLEDRGDGTWLPVSVGRVALHGDARGAVRCRSWLRPDDDDSGDVLEVDAVVLDEHGDVVAEIDRLALQRVSVRRVEEHPAPHELFYTWRWEAAKRAMAADARRWTVRGKDSIATAIERSINSDGAGDLSGTLLVLSSAMLPNDAEQLAQYCSQVACEVIDAAKGTKGSSEGPARFVVVTRGATSATSASPDPAHAGVVALCRVIAAERPDLRVQTIDLPSGVVPPVLDALVAEVRSAPSDDEVAIAGGARLARRLTHKASPTGGPIEVRCVTVGHVAGVVSSSEFDDDHFEYHELPEPTRAASSIVVRVALASVTRDERGVDAVTLVGEVIEGRTSHDPRRVVAQLRRGDLNGPLTLAQRMAVPSPRAVDLPESVSDRQALTLATLYLAPTLALRRVAAFAPGAAVLVHGADGEAGRAACDVARAAGARLFVSASSFSERDEFRAFGAEQVLASDSPALTDALLDLTSGEGVDVVLCLNDSSIDAIGDRALAAGARVLAIGEPTAGTRNNVTVGRLDLDVLAATRPAAFVAALSLAIELPQTRAQALHAALPAAIPFTEAAEAFARRNPITVVAFDRDDAKVPLHATPGSRLRQDGRYLITGGMGGIGLALASWLVRNGVRCLTLVSRNARESDATRVELAEMRSAGARVTVAQAAVEDERAMARLIDDDGSGVPIRGVFHLAGVLDDATTDHLDHERILATVRPKVVGAWVLHQLTARRPLDHFVLFSSCAATLGSPGQGNYAAANAAIDAIAAHRCAAGLPALSIAWGVWADVGLAAAASNRGDRLHARGLLAMPPALALDALGRAMAFDSRGEVGVFAVDWNRWFQSSPHAMRSARLADFASEVPAASSVGAPGAPVPASPEARAQAARERVRALVAEVLRVSIAKVSTQSLASLGLDSLMTVELRGRILDELKVDLSPSRILGASNADALAREVAAALGAPRSRDTPTMEQIPAEHLRLDPSIRALTGTARNGEPSSVLLTGATGFLGAHILRALLDDTRATVRCLVRAPDDETARARIRDTLREYRLLREGDDVRFSVVRGDLSIRHLGLTEGRMREVAASVDTIVHSGAAVNHVFPYSRLSDANVQGTQEVLRLAAMGAGVVVHHVSTLVVHPFSTGRIDDVIDELHPLADTADPFFGGYSSSKWAAEHLAVEARARGLDVRIHRPAQITGSTLAAISPAQDVVWRLIAAVAAQEVAPTLQSGISLVPVNFVARAIVALARRADAANGTFHLMSDAPFPIAAAFDAMRAIGYSLAEVAPEAWLSRVVRAADRDMPLRPVLHRLEALDLRRLDNLTMRCEAARTRSLLPAEMLHLAHVSRDLFERYLRELVARGALPTPHGGRRRPSQLPPG